VHRLALVLSAVGLLAVLLFGVAATASAIVTKVEITAGTKVTAGLQPRSVERPLDGSDVAGEFGNSSGAPVLAANDTYAVYWDPTNSYHGNWQHLINIFLQGLGADSGSLGSVFSVDAQYTDKANQHASDQSTFRGAYTDTNGYPPSGCKDPHPLDATDRIGPIVAGEHTPVCLTDKQVREQLEIFIAQHDLPRGMGPIYYLLTPPGVTVCLDGGGSTGHCSDFKGSIAEIEKDEQEKATKEAEKKTYAEPEVYKSYEDSFCSYHSDISPTSPLEGGANTILYAVIPWIAGGKGDYHLTEADETSAYECQDGGWDPTTNPSKREAPRVKSVTEITEDEKKTLEEQAKLKEAEEREGPHVQEPNQDGLGEDGSYDYGLADVIISQIGAEQQNIVTNPLLNAWQDTAGKELTDECRNFFSPVIGGNVGALEKTFAGTLYNQSFGGVNSYLNEAFNLAAVKVGYPGVPCLGGINLVPQFTAPNPAKAGDILGFDGMESDITLDAGPKFSSEGVEETTYPTFTWNFGDGTPTVSGYAPGAPSLNSPETSPCEAPWIAPCAASTFHSYQYGGTYNVTLTVTDVGGDTGSVTHAVTVVGPAPPSPPTLPSSTTPVASPSISGTPTAGSSQSKTVTPTPTPAPVLTAAVESTSLKKVKSGGLAVRYTVNEQVAGSVQVLLESATARRLGVKGPLATGLAKGSPSAIVIGTAVLVTTKAGAGTIRIKFSSKTAARLARSHKLKLMLRLVARNASRQSPQTATLLSTVVLTG
jgi:hypothetical protein